MISLDDPIWKEPKDGYKIPYNPAPVIKSLEKGNNIEEAWKELWNELYHQGDLGEASYAIVPHLVKIQKEKRCFDWNFYGLISVIEIERHRKTNPPIPDWLIEDYKKAWDDILEIVILEIKKEKDPYLVKCLLGTLAAAKGNNKLSAIILELEEPEHDEILEHYFGWDEIYK